MQWRSVLRALKPRPIHAVWRIDIALLVLLLMLSDHRWTQPISAATAPIIRNVTPNATTIARYDKFEIQFDVTTIASNLDLPFDAAPPPGMTPEIGVSVNALFSRDNWQTTITQPAFFYQAFTITTRGGKDHQVPNGAPKWTVRFTPQQAGVWQYRLRAQDAGGTTIYPASGALTMTVSGDSANASKRHGFLRVSLTDKRYFEFQDGTPFIGVGFDDGFDYTANVESKMQRYEQNKMNLMRVWLNSAGINGSHWSSWSSHHLPNDGYLPGVRFDTQTTFAGSAVSMRLDAGNPCFFADFAQGGVPVQPNTTYRVTARVKLNNVTGPQASGTYGFVIKQADWLGANCNQVNGTAITSAMTGTTNWTTVTGLYTTSANQYWLDYLYLNLQNATGGEVYIDDVRLWRESDSLKINLLREPNANSHLYFDPLNAAKWDEFIESAEQHGVYLKIVVDEKSEWIRNHLDANGAMTITGSNDNFYAAPGRLVRWLQQAWWRYVIARWGYSPAIHSFEYINEGDPYNGRHYEAANAMARYLHQNDPARHLVTTSFWHSFPNIEFWSNPNFSDIDYADIHAYHSNWGGNASFLDARRTETRTPFIRSGNASARLAGTDNSKSIITPRGLVIRGPGEWIVRYWMKANAFTANCSFGTSGGMQRVRWLIDGGVYAGGKEGVVPFNNQGKDFVCASPAGTFDWRQFRSDRDRDGNILPTPYRIVLADNAPHEISLQIENTSGTGGEVWFDDIELVSPAGQVVPVIGQFDITPMGEDTAWYHRAYAELWGGASPVGANKPLIRGEGAIDRLDGSGVDLQLNQDTAGIWLHNAVWAQISAGGMSDLFWWATETIPPRIYSNYLTYRNFMQGIPLNNGNYHDANATTSNPNLRAWGQRDSVHNRIHLWIQNTQHAWKRVVANSVLPIVSGTITLANVADGNYQVTWWSTYNTTNPVFLTQTVTTDAGMLTLTLPHALTDDVAVKIERTGGGASFNFSFLPLLQKTGP